MSKSQAWLHLNKIRKEDKIIHEDKKREKILEEENKLFIIDKPWKIPIENRSKYYGNKATTTEELECQDK